MAARNENYQNIIKKNYRKKIILIDRFTDSTIAYQHFGMGLDRKIIKILNRFILNKIEPDFIFLNIVNKKNLINRLRLRNNKNRYDKFKFVFYNKVQNGYLKLAKNKKKYIIIDSNKSIFENKKNIINKIQKILSL
jgi:dTMP kinase